MRSPHCCDATPLPGVQTGDIISLLLLSPTPVALSDSSSPQSPRAESLKHNARSHGVPEPRAAPAAALNPLLSAASSTITVWVYMHSWRLHCVYVHARVSLYLHAGVCVCAKDQRRRDQGSSGCLLLIMAGFSFFLVPFPTITESLY